MKKFFLGLGLGLAALAAVAVPAVRACDSCGCSMHTPTLFSDLEPASAPKTGKPPVPDREAEPDPKRVVPVVPVAAPKEEGYWFAGTEDQFTGFGTLKNHGARTDDGVGQYEQSLNAQLFVGKQINDWVSLQLNVPVLFRSYRRPNWDGSGVDKDSLAGVGDIALVANFTPWRIEKKEWGLAWNVGGGLKLPTGDPRRLKEELLSNLAGDGGGPESAIGGHDLALGSGSVDELFSTGLHYRWGRFFAEAETQFSLRNRGSYGYRYANELGWSGGPGYVVWKNAEGLRSLSLQLRTSGESKGADTLAGIDESDTGNTAVYLGPKLALSWDNRWVATAGVDLPVQQQNSALQEVPDYRVHTGITWRF